MITEKQLVLIARKEIVSDLNYEAIELITNVEDITDVWKRNKTPLIEDNTATSLIAKAIHPTLEVSDFISDPESFISLCHKNGFECGEYISGQKFDTSKDNCFLCGISNYMGIEGPCYIYNKEVTRDSDLIIYESENFFVKIELGCLKPGMLMINPKTHISQLHLYQKKIWLSIKL